MCDVKAVDYFNTAIFGLFRAKLLVGVLFKCDLNKVCVSRLYVFTLRCETDSLG